MSSERLRIGAFARQCGVSVATIRFYERRGLLPAPLRRASGVREYSSRVAEQVRLVRWLNGLGFSLAEIATLVSAWRAHQGRGRGALRARAAEKRRELDAEMARLQTARRLLDAIVACDCTGDCPVLSRAMGRDAKPQAAALRRRGATARRSR